MASSTWSMWLARCILIVMIMICTSTVIRTPRSTQTTVEHIRSTLFHMQYDNQTYDLVFILDRSTGVNRNKFYFQQKVIAYNTIRQHVRATSDHTRVSMISFGNTVSVEFDFIFNGNVRTFQKCQLMERDDLWEQTQYRRDRVERDGTNITGALDEAMIILDRGRGRRLVNNKQLIIMMTDLDWKNEETPTRSLSDMLTSEHYDVDVLLVGVGSFLRRERVEDFLGDFGLHKFSEMTDWEEVLLNSPVTNNVAASSHLGWVDSTTGSCPACDQGWECQCDVVTGFSQCQRCDVGKSSCCPNGRCPEAPVYMCDRDVICLNGGTCVPGDHGAACICPWGFQGRVCELDYNECDLEAVCPVNALCTDKVNGVECECADKRPPDDQDVCHGVFPDDPNNTSTDRVAPLEDENDKKLETLLWITGPAGGLAFIIIIVSIIALCYIMRRKRKLEDHNNTMKTDTTSLNSKAPSVTTMLTFDSKIYTDEGVPMAPTYLSHADLRDNVYPDVNIHGNQPVTLGMEEWVPYVMELPDLGVHRVLVVRLDAEKYVMTPDLTMNSSETSYIHKMLARGANPKTVTMQGRSFKVTSKKDLTLIAENKSGEKTAQEILCASKSRQFIVIGLAARDTDSGQCQSEISRLTDYIRKQGL